MGCFCFTLTKGGILCIFMCPHCVGVAEQEGEQCIIVWFTFCLWRSTCLKSSTSSRFERVMPRRCHRRERCLSFVSPRATLRLRTLRRTFSKRSSCGSQTAKRCCGRFAPTSASRSSRPRTPRGGPITHRAASSKTFFIHLSRVLFYFYIQNRIIVRCKIVETTLIQSKTQLCS